MSIDWTQVSVLIRPLVPNSHTIILEILDVGVSCDEPQKFVDYGFEMDLLGGQQRKAFAKVKTHLVTEHTLCSSACAVAFECAILSDMA